MTCKFEPDYSLIRAWNRQTAGTLPFDGPFVARFGTGTKRLHYVAAQHEGGIESPTLQTVRREFDSFHPDVVIVEGAPYTGEISPAWYLDHCRTQAENDFAGGGESAYATVLAAERGIDFVPAEPLDDAVCTAICRQGYTQEDFFNWRAIVLLTSRLSLSDVGDADVPAAVTAWYERQMGKPFSLEALAGDDLSPSDGVNASFLQRMAHESDRVREPHIVKIISKQLARHDRVLVVFGSAHLAKQAPVFEKMLGAPQHFSFDYRLT
jgi:hypothetical protein